MLRVVEGIAFPVKRAFPALLSSTPRVRAMLLPPGQHPTRWTLAACPHRSFEHRIRAPTFSASTCTSQAGCRRSGDAELQPLIVIGGVAGRGAELLPIVSGHALTTSPMEEPENVIIDG